jgi:hypothetical protein
MHLFCCKMLTCQCTFRPQDKFIYFSQCMVIIPSVSRITEYHNGTYENKSYLGIIPDQLALQQIIANLLDLFAFVHQKNWLCCTCQGMSLVSTGVHHMPRPYKCWNEIYILETLLIWHALDTPEAQWCTIWSRYKGRKPGGNSSSILMLHKGRSREIKMTRLASHWGNRKGPIANLV